MERGQSPEVLAHEVRQLLSEQGLGPNEVIHFATQLLDAVIGEVREAARPPDGPRP